jgi:hypothetical protein
MGEGASAGESRAGFEGLEVWNCLVRFSCHAFLML